MIRRLFYNTGSNLASFFVTLVITFVMAPIYLGNMGHYDYGLREMVLAVVGYMGMLDLGMQPTMSRFTAMHNAVGDRDGLLAVYATSLVFMGIVGLILALFFLFWGAIFPEILAPADAAGSVEKYRLFLLLVSANLFFIFPQNVAVSHLEGLQRYYLKNVINSAFAIMVAVTSCVLITPENALLLLTGLVALSTFLKLLIFGGILMTPAMGVVRPELKRFSRFKLKEMLSFGLKSFVQGVAFKIDTASDRLVIGGIIGPAAVPFYTIPATLVGYINTISMNLTHVFLPLFSDLDAQGQQIRIQRIYLVTSKLVVGLIVPMAVGISVVGGPFVDIWMHGQFDRHQMDMIIFLLALYYTIPKLNPLAGRYLTAIGRHGIFARVTPLLALANLGLSILLVMKMGVVGAALGSVFPVFVGLPVFLHYSCRHLHMSMTSYLRTSVLPSIIPAAIMAVVIIWFRSESGLSSYGQVLTCVGLGGAVYLPTFWIFSVNAEERATMRVLLKRT